MKAYLRCPSCHSIELMLNDLDIHCKDCGVSYPISFNRPVMFRHDNDVFCFDDYKCLVNPEINSNKKQPYLKLSASINLSSQKILNLLGSRLAERSSANILVVGGGCQKKWLDALLKTSDLVQIIYSDIDTKADVDLFCDGHDLPFVDSFFDAVVTTAVLEHVLYPERVASEITRVLKVGGLLYSELPFMQQVHEGAYDFTRYTLSGHRRLFNNIHEIDSGMVAGPGTALVWSIENFFLAFFEKPRFRLIVKFSVRMFFGWIKYFDFYLESKSSAMDGASCTFLYGEKKDSRVSDKDIIDNYVGSKNMKHT